jgi:hypothetical protein
MGTHSSEYCGGSQEQSLEVRIARRGGHCQLGQPAVDRGQPATVGLRRRQQLRGLGGQVEVPRPRGADHLAAGKTVIKC